MDSAEAPIRALYHELLACWNKRDAEVFAGLFDGDGVVGGFEGCLLKWAVVIKSTVAKIFEHHQTPAYVGKVRRVRFLVSDVAILTGVAGMVPPHQTDINPALNAIQTLVAIKRGGEWLISLFQNTPAQFHGRPEVSQALTEELRQLLP